MISALWTYYHLFTAKKMQLCYLVTMFNDEISSILSLCFFENPTDCCLCSLVYPTLHDISVLIIFFPCCIYWFAQSLTFAFAQALGAIYLLQRLSVSFDISKVT
jgi:hypothetical protein